MPALPAAPQRDLTPPSPLLRPPPHSRSPASPPASPVWHHRSTRRHRGVVSLWTPARPSQVLRAGRSLVNISSSGSKTTRLSPGCRASSRSCTHQASWSNPYPRPSYFGSAPGCACCSVPYATSHPQAPHWPQWCEAPCGSLPPRGVAEISLICRGSRARKGATGIATPSVSAEEYNFVPSAGSDWVDSSCVCSVRIQSMRFREYYTRCRVSECTCVCRVGPLTMYLEVLKVIGTLKRSGLLLRGRRTSF